MDRLPVTIQTIWTKSYSDQNPVTLSCGASDGGTDRSYVFARARRFTAITVDRLVTQ
jgi:hypothetical protein